MNRRIKKDFYTKDAITVAKNLLGKIICHKLENGKILKGIIVETEAYTQEEPSCHAYCGITKRSKTLFLEGGILYVYFTYGMHYCANIVTDKHNFGSAVLIRAVEPIVELSEYTSTNGPAKFCKAFKITTHMNEVSLCENNSPIWLEYNENISNENIIQTTRIGISKAVDLPWRFYIKDNKYVSKK